MGKNTRKRLPLCKPYLTSNEEWALTFRYQGQVYSNIFGKGDRAKTIAKKVSAKIIQDIVNDCFKNSIELYLPKKKPKKYHPPNPNPKLQIPNNQCLGCGSIIRVRNGTVNGKQRWKCCDCGRQRLENADYPFPTGKKCYLCGETTAKKGKRNGVQQYQCNNCGAYWSDRNLPEVPQTIDWYNEGLLG